MNKKDFECNGCGNTKYFYKDVLATITFNTKTEMESKSGPVSVEDWMNDFIYCNECGESDVKEINNELYTK